MEKENKTRNLPVKIARVTAKTILYILLFVVVIFLLILTPPVQRFLTGKVQNYLEKKLNTIVRIGQIGFGLSGNINLNDIYIQDLTKDTLVAGGSIKANLNFLKLFSNEVEVKDIEFKNVTAKIKRILPDTIFNFQFIADAFATQQTVDTTAAPLKLNISDLTLDNVRLTYTDAVTGNDVFARIGYLTSTIDTLDPYSQNFSFPSLIVRNTSANIKQMKPLVEPKSISKDMAEAATPAAMKLNVGNIEFNKVNVQFNNDVSAFYSDLTIGNLKLDGKLLDLQQNKIHFDELVLGRTKAAIRIGKQETKQLVKQEINQEVEAEKTTGWDIRIDRIRFDDNNIVYDDDNRPRTNYGMDYAHLNAKNFDLHIDNFIMNTDSIYGSIVKGSFSEKNGFVLNDLRGDLLYGSNQSYLRDLYIKTPGSELKRSALLEYASVDALVKNFENTVMDVD
ncbi:MAG TPA: hypothetical protein VM368_00290, partial [Flavisolibacter sp.]|nr:hypothetical protein [Flavisolibacter sp.]